MIRSRTRSGTPGRPTPRRRRSSASLALATGGSFKIRWTVRCETRNCAAISLVECPASRRARTACRSSILSILLWPPLHENVGGRPKRRLQMPQDATEFREDRRQSLENPHRAASRRTRVCLAATSLRSVRLPPAPYELSGAVIAPGGHDWRWWTQAPTPVARRVVVGEGAVAASGRLRLRTRGIRRRGSAALRPPARAIPLCHWWNRGRAAPCSSPG